MSKSVYFFSKDDTCGSSDMKDLLGGKGANLAEMSKCGIPVPPGFTVVTSECIQYYNNDKNISQELKDEIMKNLEKLESVMGKKLGSEQAPLLVSVRSGAKFSMPGMMDTILNLGLNDKTVEVMANLTKNPKFVYDSYRRLIQMYGDVVLSIDHFNFEQILSDIKFSKGIINDCDLSLEDIMTLISRYKQLVKKETGKEFPQDVYEQLFSAIEAVFVSWNNDRAIYYRNIHDIDHNCGTAVNIQAMVFGNMGETSATGVAFTRNPSTGENKVYGEYLINAQGEDVVAGIRTPNVISKLAGSNSLEEKMPEVYKSLVEIFNKLENHYKDMQDVEFTIQQGKLWILQTRNGKRSIEASLKIAVDMVNEKLISKQEALLRIDAGKLDQILHPVIDRNSKLEILATGLPASPGAVSGRIAMSTEFAKEIVARGEKAILVREETSPSDIAGMNISSGILTSRGGMTSHAAVVARGMGKACVCGCEAMKVDMKNESISINGKMLKNLEYITIDGSSGDVINGVAQTADSSVNPNFELVMKWCVELGKTKIRANAETEKDCKKAIEFGVAGIGLCRTEHMFFEKTKLLYFRKVILSNSTKERVDALKEIEALQQKDFESIFNIVKGLPVNIRLLDPPLHEFLPHSDEEIAELSEKFNISKEEIKRRASELDEVNPMLGHRGSRLGITYPEIFEMQVRAIFNAACAVKTEKPLIEVMLPIILDKKELEILVTLVKNTADGILKSNNLDIKYKVGTMIELPRACLVADEIAEIADYCSFGTNDLTQTTLGISRDDAQRFLKSYQDQGIFEKDPFVTVDKGVVEMLKIAESKARSVKKDITLSVCGEHGGDPKSIKEFVSIGVNYLSCSPYRTPIARLSAVQEEIKQKKI